MTGKPDDDPLLGSFVGSYRLVRVLGRGGMGRVYAALQPEVGSRVAIKVIAEQYARDPELIERFFAEARAVNLIRHENIVSVLDLAHLADGRPVIVMELVEGRTLREVIHAGAAPLGGVVQVMLDVLSALAAAHAVGIVHRDLKPDNIVVMTNGRAKVLDFGIAKLMAPTAGQHRGPRTRTGVILGTPEYMAPEQISGGEVDQRSDVYAMGVVLFEAVTGRRPFLGKSDFDVMRAHVDQAPPSPRALRSDLPPAIEAVILAALAKPQDERFASATAMANALHAASEAVPVEQWRSLTPRALQIARPLTPPPPPDHGPTDPQRFDPAHWSHETEPAMPRELAPTARATPGAQSLAAMQGPPTARATPGAQLAGPDTAHATPGSRERGQAMQDEPVMNRETAEVVRDVRAELVTRADRADDMPRDRASDLELRDRASDLAIDPRAARGSELAIDQRPTRVAAAPRTRSRALVLGSVAIAVTAAVVAILVLRPQRGAAPEAVPGDAVALVTSDTAVVASVDAPAPEQDLVSVAPVVDAGTTKTRVKLAGGSTTTPAPPPQQPAASGKSPTTANLANPGNPRTYDLDYAPKKVDPVAYIPRAQAIARTQIGDAVLVLIDFKPVLSDGNLDLTRAGADTKYWFASQSAMAAPAGSDATRPCFVVVELTAAGPRAYGAAAANCSFTALSPIQCTTAEVWKRAISDKGQAAGSAAKITMVQSARKHWEFTTAGAAEAVFIEDDCKTPKDVASNPRGFFSVPAPKGPFDPIRYAATALELARKLEPDALLIEIDTFPVARDGTLDVTLDDDDRRVIYRFQSPARAKDPPLPRDKQHNAPYRWCQIDVVLERQEPPTISVQRSMMSECKDAAAKLPHCSAKQLWAKILAAAKEDPGPTTYLYYHPGIWQVATKGDDNDDHRFVEKLPDDCK